MKKIILLLGVILCLFTSCKPMEKYEYECTINYTLNGTPYEDTTKIVIDNTCIPVYVCGNGELLISAAPSTYYYGKIIYKGHLKVEVQDFNYKLIRTFKASKITGKEL